MGNQGNQVEISSWTELVEQLYLDSWQDGLKRFRSSCAFRGISDKDYPPETSLMRLGGRYHDLEMSLIRNFVKYARIADARGYTIWNWLAIAQHHGLPTRLLDWTYSPFVAAHFATYDVEQYHQDGVIWCVDFVKAHALLPQVLRDQMMRERSDVFTVEMLADASLSLQDFDALSESDFLLFFEPPSLDDRIVNQFALHSVISNPRATLADFLSSHPELHRRVVIPRELKWEIRDKLDQANINERVMFPGLDGLSRWLTRYYRPR